MISKCANPKCNLVFRYLHEGRLFQFDMKPSDEPSAGRLSVSKTDTTSRKLEYFWLCDACASRMTLVREPRTHEVVMVPVREGIQERGDDSAKEVYNFRVKID